jgi:dCTP deaminase
LILSKPDILRYLTERKLRFDPPIQIEQVAQVSVDLRLGNRFSRFKKPPGYLPAINVDRSLWDSADLWDHREAEVFRLEPGEFVVAQTHERVYIPNDLMGLVEGRSSFARVGVTVHVTAPKIDPGFDAKIALEMANFGKVAVELRAGVDAPAQLLLMRLTTPLAADELYGSDPRDVFQHQTDPIPRGRK